MDRVQVLKDLILPNLRSDPFLQDRSGIPWLGIGVISVIFFLLLQLPTPLQDVSTEQLFHEIATLWCIMVSISLVFIWTREVALQKMPFTFHPLKEPLFPYLMLLAFSCIFMYEGNIDREFREEIGGMIILGIPLLPFVLIPMKWHQLGNQRGIFLVLLGFLLMAFSTVLDYHHDHSGEGLELFDHLGSIDGLEETLELWGLIAISWSFIALAQKQNPAVRTFMNRSTWNRYLGTLVIFSVGLGFWLGSDWDWDDVEVYYHIFGGVVLIIGLCLSLRILTGFFRVMHEIPDDPVKE